LRGEIVRPAAPLPGVVLEVPCRFLEATTRIAVISASHGQGEKEGPTKPTMAATPTVRLHLFVGIRAF